MNKAEFNARLMQRIATGSATRSDKEMFRIMARVRARCEPVTVERKEKRGRYGDRMLQTMLDIYSVLETESDLSIREIGSRLGIESYREDSSAHPIYRALENLTKMNILGVTKIVEGTLRYNRYRIISAFSSIEALEDRINTIDWAF